LILKKLFKEFDANQSGFIDFNEFQEMTKSMGLFLKKDDLVKLFAQADKKGNGGLNFDQFKFAIKILQNQVAVKAMEKVGLSKEDLTIVLIYSIFTLLLLYVNVLIFRLVFIFLGISAFSSVSPFNGVVNASLPASAGGLLKGKAPDMEKVEKQIKGTVEKVVGTLRGEE
jgi:hypothetical protein